VNIAIVSAWRDSAHNVRRYMAQAVALQKHIGPSHTVSVIAVEGDSTDATQETLQREGEAAHARAGVHTYTYEFDQHTPRFGSTEAPERMAALSQLGNAMLDCVQEQHDVVVYVESDLLWNAHTIGSLADIANEQRDGVDVVAPMVMAGDCFYDIWAFRGLDGNRFSPFYPFHPSLNFQGPTPVNSVGSCLVMKGDVARNKKNRMVDGALVQWCDTARSNGYRIAAHANFKVTHP